MDSGCREYGYRKGTISTMKKNAIIREQTMVQCHQEARIRTIACIMFIGVLLLLSCSLAYGAERQHYIDGEIGSIDRNALLIQVAGNNYTIVEKYRIMIHYKEGDSFYRKKATLFDIDTGDLVTIRTNGKDVFEIIKEEWKQ